MTRVSQRLGSIQAGFLNQLYFSYRARNIVAQPVLRILTVSNDGRVHTATIADIPPEVTQNEKERENVRTKRGRSKR